MVQVNIFSCGGLVIGLYTSHKMVDGFSATLFWKSWAAEAKGISYKEFPEFDTHEMFPLISTLPKYASLVMWPTLMGKCKCVARVFVFESSAISALKKDAIVCSTVLKKKSKQSCGCVNLRGKTSPPSFNSIGNMLWFAVARYEPESTNKNIELSSVVGCLQDAISEIDINFVEELKGDKGLVNVMKHMAKFEIWLF
ncbi:hypothetical protein LIER_43377 [Lithospermum erythrorhizon]|uniref:Uncharacterized protein n=1 Tax=Lithospermum erythrorhizon TaxID=34254 RepID=A0AAV3PZG6_LITER